MKMEGLGIPLKTNGRVITPTEKHEEEIQQIKHEISELKEEIFSLTMQVERLQECEKMEQEEKGRKNKKYIVHRRTSDGTELYLGQPLKNGGYVVIYEQTGDKSKATKFTMEEAIKVRNEKNKHFENCLTQWVISEVK